MTTLTDYTINLSLDYRNHKPVIARVDLCELRGRLIANVTISGSNIEQQVIDWLALHAGRVERPLVEIEGPLELGRPV